MTTTTDVLFRATDISDTLTVTRSDREDAWTVFTIQATEAPYECRMILLSPDNTKALRKALKA